MDDIHVKQVDVDGLLYFVFRILGFIGAVPLRFQKCGSMHCINLSRSRAWSGPLIVTVLCACIIVGLVWDFCMEDRSHSIHVTTAESSLFWTLNICILCATSIVGIYDAPNRTRKFILVINYLNKANFQINAEVKPRQKESLKKTLFITYFFIVSIGILFDFFVHRREAIRKHSNMDIYYLYSCCYPLYILNYLVSVQLALILRTINNSHHLLNETLGSITKNLNGEVLMINTEKQLRQIASHYVRLCEVKILLNNQEGPIALLNFIMFLTNMINMSLDLISIILYRASSEMKMFFIIDHCFWILMYITNFTTVIQYCQKTEAKIERTKALVSRMCHVVSSNDPLIRNLDFLFYLLQTLNPQYSPLGLFDTTRSFVFTVFNSALSYVIVFIQFHFNTSF